jgi:hypothetical protein
MRSLVEMLVVGSDGSKTSRISRIKEYARVKLSTLSRQRDRIFGRMQKY